MSIFVSSLSAAKLLLVERWVWTKVVDALAVLSVCEVLVCEFWLLLDVWVVEVLLGIDWELRLAGLDLGLLYLSIIKNRNSIKDT